MTRDPMRDALDAGRLLAAQSARGNRDADRLAAALTAAGIDLNPIDWGEMFTLGPDAVWILPSSLDEWTPAAAWPPAAAPVDPTPDTGRGHPYRVLVGALLFMVTLTAVTALYVLTSAATFWHVIGETYAALVILGVLALTAAALFARPAQEATDRHVERALAEGNAQMTSTGTR